MSSKLTRRSAVLTGLAALVAPPMLSNCGGGGSGGGDQGGSPSASGSLWYEEAGELFVVPDSGAGTPRSVNKVAVQRDTLFDFQVSRQSPRYIQVGTVGAGSDVSAICYCHEHADNSTYCFINVVGYVSLARVSPTGNYVAMLRSPEVVNARYDTSPEIIVGLTIVDISNVNSIRDIRSAFRSGDDSIRSFSWLGGDEFVYITVGGSIVRGSAAGGATADRVLGVIDARGLEIGEADVSPDGARVLVRLFDGDGRTSGNWDIYLYETSGTFVGQVTDTGSSYAPLWSPDGTYLMFKDGSPLGCGVEQGPSCCSAHLAVASSRMLTLPSAQLLDSNKLPCIYETFWSSQTGTT